MKHVGRMLAIPTVCMALLLHSCSSTTDAPADPTQVALYTQMQSSSVTPSTVKVGDGNTITSHGLIADSLHITRVRILVKDVKLHRDHDDAPDSDKAIKAGPFLITVTPGNATITAANPIPQGSYDCIKLEVHRFNNSEVATFINDTLFGDFVTNDRYSIIVDGEVFENGVAHSFRYNSAVTLNLNIKADSNITVTLNNTKKLLLLIDPSLCFHVGFFVADPRDPNNRELIENNIRYCFHAFRHFL